MQSGDQESNTVLAWLKCSIQEPRPLLLQVLQHLRLPLLSPKFLVHTVGSDPHFKSNKECRDLVNDTENYLLVAQERPLRQGPGTWPRKPVHYGEVLFEPEPVPMEDVTEALADE